KINLVSLKAPQELWTRHFLDSLSAAPFVLNRGGTLLDLGAGGGFPGLPLKIVFPELKIFLLESSRKKSSFLNHAIRLLGLPQATVINERVENILVDNKYRHGFDTVISRAAFKLPELVRYSAYLLAANGMMIAMKGGKVLDGELAEAQAIAPAVGLAFLSCHDTKNERTGERRIILLFKKYRPVDSS
ncbi:MAG: 16S rRNA (guanine(527)-N(7))-methyltransferase RsmG, partial [Smithellaceae bacterium]|nr:16S rRNA (guanine(527)-N(7))-methyltransferase RsmG [Smithellaceae bacterium]